MAKTKAAKAKAKTKQEILARITEINDAIHNLNVDKKAEFFQRELMNEKKELQTFLRKK